MVSGSISALTRTPRSIARQVEGSIVLIGGSALGYERLGMDGEATERPVGCDGGDEPLGPAEDRLGRLVHALALGPGLTGDGELDAVASARAHAHGRGRRTVADVHGLGQLADDELEGLAGGRAADAHERFGVAVGERLFGSSLDVLDALGEHHGITRPTCA